MEGNSMKSWEDAPIRIQELLAFYNENYEVIGDYDTVPEPNRKFDVGSSHRPRKCRYCQLVEPVVSFRSKAHAFPAMIGNNTVFANDECDSCNQWFGNNLDVHLSRYLGIELTVHQIRGRKRVPTYRVPGKSPRMELNMPNRLHAESTIGDRFLTLSDNGAGKLRAPRQPYNPRSVYKCLVKMALAIVPEEELFNYTEALAWILLAPEKDPWIKYPFFTCITCTWKEKDYPGVRALLLRRQPGRDVPYMMFVIDFHYRGFQICLPFSPKDSRIKEVRIQNFPSVAEVVTQVGYRLKDFSRNELVKNEVKTYNIEYDGELVIKGDDSLLGQIREKG